MNAGAYGGQMGRCAHRRDGGHPDRGDAEAAAEELELGYRHSVLMKTGGVVTEAVSA